MMEKKFARRTLLKGALASLAALPAAEVDAVIAEYQRAFTWWRECDAITVAAVQGHAVGAGFQLALACDLIVVDPTAQFCMKEPQLGLVPDLAGTSPLVAAVGYPRALEICASGRWVSAEEALVLGIAVDYGVHIVHDSLERPGPYRISPSTANSVLVDALTTILGFGALMVASHRGLESLGRLLTLGVTTCTVTSLVFLPAVLRLLHREPQAAAHGSADGAGEEGGVDEVIAVDFGAGAGRSAGRAAA